MIRFNVNTSNYGSLFGYGSRVKNQKSLYSTLSRMPSVKAATATRSFNSYYSKVKGRNNNLFTDGKGSQKLMSATDKLTNLENNNLFRSKKSYDADAAFKMANDFVNNYNDAVTALDDADSVSIKSAGSSMSKMTNIMKNSLKRAGITVGKDGMLSINEEEFKKADMDTVKNLFGGTSSYAKIISTSAQRVQDAVYKQQGVNARSIYGRSGLYYNSLFSGKRFNGLF